VFALQDTIHYLCSMKVYLYIGIAVVVIVLTVALGITLKSNSDMEEQWKTAMENVKSYSAQVSTSEGQNRALKMSVEQLNYTSDSILQELNATRNELKVKDSKLQSLQYVSSSFVKSDTIVLKDTVFKDKHVAVDTLVSDEWYSIRVGLEYPSTIAIKPEFKSEKNIIVSSKKETVNPPKKFFLWRWLQKKQTVLNIDVVEKNPYIEEQTSRYVEILR
jgi:hypothetical protein